MAKGIYELLTEIKPRPAMWFGVAAIGRLDAFLHGFWYAHENYLVPAFEMPPFELLHDWTATRFNQGYSTAGWCNILINECQGDEVAALQLFFTLLEEFKRVQAVRVVEVVLGPDNLAFFYSEACQVRRYNVGPSKEETRSLPPDKIYIIQFSGGLGYYAFHHREGELIDRDRYYSSFRAALKQLRQEFGPTLHYQDSNDLSLSAIKAIMQG
ncbi:MAG: hypothetical protein EOO63_02285 [Hymenobacter sp.]|nr:MAG: hypothetical protein EOO63_02285 [Hymenobacter sp.]